MIQGNAFFKPINVPVNIMFACFYRLAIKKVCLCPMSGVLAVAGTAGHVVMAKINGEATELKVIVFIIIIIIFTT